MTKPQKSAPPYLRCDWDIPVVAAVQALSRGEATPEQQKQFLNWQINICCGTYDQTFQELGERESSFAAGRRQVGLWLVKLLHLSTNALRKATPHE